MIAAGAKCRCSARDRRRASVPISTAGFGGIAWVVSGGVHATVLAVFAAWGGPSPHQPVIGAIAVELVVVDGGERPGAKAHEQAGPVVDAAAAAPVDPIVAPTSAADLAPAPDDATESSTQPRSSLLARVTPPRKPKALAPTEIVASTSKPVAAPTSAADPAPAPDGASELSAQPRSDPLTPEVPPRKSEVSVPPEIVPSPAAPLSPSRDSALGDGVRADEPIQGAQALVSESVASLAGAMGRVAAAPRADNPKPVYPAYARRRGIEGRVVLRLDVTAEGSVDDVLVVESSGHDSLDQAAVTAVRLWHFHPAERDGAPVPSLLQVPIVFGLTE